MTPQQLEIDDDLEKVERLLQDPERWTQNAAARNGRGHIVPPLSSNAVSFCLMGACAREQVSMATRQFLDTYLNGIAAFNDEPERAHEDIMILIDDARTALREEN